MQAQVPLQHCSGRSKIQGDPTGISPVGQVHCVVVTVAETVLVGAFAVLVVVVLACSET